jgi:hypothetical protein
MYILYSVLTLALDEGEWLASHPDHTLLPGKDPFDTHWIGGWMGLRAGLGTELKLFHYMPRRILGGKEV